MSVDVLDIKNSIKNLLDKNNTNTSDYDISASLNKRVQKITSANSRLAPQLNINYPCVFVELKNIRDAHIELGNSARRDIEAQIDIVSVVNYGVGTTNANEKSDDECIQLTQNIVELMRNSIKISNTVDSVIVDSLDFDVDEGTYNSQSRISLLIKKRG